MGLAKSRTRLSGRAPLTQSAARASTLLPVAERAASSKSRASFPFLRIWYKSRENGSSVDEAAWDAEARRSGRLRGPCF